MESKEVGMKTVDNLPYPYTVEHPKAPEPVPPLMSGLAKLLSDNSKNAHLLPRERRAVAKHITSLTERVKILEMQISADWGDE